MIADIKAAREAAKIVSDKHNADVFFYNGGITRANVLSVMESIQKNKSRDNAFLLLVTYGGDPHASFKISRYFQSKYNRFQLFVPGFCKSAGTLLAVAANEIIFAPFGELGPLDVQIAKPDQYQFDSGLIIVESLDTMERRATELFKRVFNDMLAEQQSLISIPTAMQAAAEVTKAVYGQMAQRIDPDEIGNRQRALRIAIDYGSRLAIRSQNIDPRHVRLLTEKYSSHSFVIDQLEASSLFRNTRPALDIEMSLAYALGSAARIEQSGVQIPQIEVLSEPYGTGEEHGGADATQDAERDGNSPSDGESPGGADGAPLPEADQPTGGGGGGVRPGDAPNAGTAATDPE